MAPKLGQNQNHPQQTPNVLSIRYIPTPNLSCKWQPITQVIQIPGFYNYPRCQVSNPNKEENCLISRYLQQNETHPHKRKHKHPHKNPYLEDACMVHCSRWMLMPDPHQRARKKTRGSGEAVHQKNVEEIMDWDESKCRNNRFARVRKIWTTAYRVHRQLQLTTERVGP